MDRVQVCLVLVLLAVVVCDARKHKDGEKHHDTHKHHDHHHGHHKSGHDHGKSVSPKHVKTSHNHDKMHNTACEKKYFSGCNIDNHAGGKCVCKYKVAACSNPFHYKHKKDCHKDKLGKLNKCRNSPCHNHGECVQVINRKTGKQQYKCECAGTGYYGNRCQKKCPENRLHKNYPAECVLVY